MVGANSNHGSLPWQEFAPPRVGLLEQTPTRAKMNPRRGKTISRGRSAVVSGAELFAPATLLIQNRLPGLLKQT